MGLLEREGGRLVGVEGAPVLALARERLVSELGERLSPGSLVELRVEGLQLGVGAITGCVHDSEEARCPHERPVRCRHRREVRERRSQAERVADPFSPRRSPQELRGLVGGAPQERGNTQIAERGSELREIPMLRRASSLQLDRLAAGGVRLVEIAAHVRDARAPAGPLDL